MHMFIDTGIAVSAAVLWCLILHDIEGNMLRKEAASPSFADVVRARRRTMRQRRRAALARRLLGLAQ